MRRAMMAALLLLSALAACSARLYKPPPDSLMSYHHGKVLAGDIPVALLWYGDFSPAHKSVVVDFILSLTGVPASKAPAPSVSQWWRSVERLYLSKASRVVISGQVDDGGCSLGKNLKSADLAALAARAGARKGGVAVVLTARDVLVEGFCRSRCGTHGAGARSDYAYIWVGDSGVQCPGQCAWPFHQPIYGPQSPPLVAPNGDAGIDGVVINLASMFAGAVTNPYGGGYFQGPKEAPLEAATACTGVYGSGAYPGFAGKLEVDPATGGSFNAHGAGGKKFLLPAIFDPSTASCSTLV